MPGDDLRNGVTDPLAATFVVQVGVDLPDKRERVAENPVTKMATEPVPGGARPGGPRPLRNPSRGQMINPRDWELSLPRRRGLRNGRDRRDQRRVDARAREGTRWS